MSQTVQFVICTGNPQQDLQALQSYQAQYAAGGYTFNAWPLPTGGYQVQAVPPAPAQGPRGTVLMNEVQSPSTSVGAAGTPWQPGQPQPVYGQPQPQPAAGYAPPPGTGYVGQPGVGAPAAYAMGAGAMAYAQPAAGVVDTGLSLDAKRLAHIRKVYSLLGLSMLLAIIGGATSLNIGGTVDMVSPEGIPATVPLLVSILLGSRAMAGLAFGVLFVATLIASAVSKVRILNVVALFGVALLMGLQIAPMIYVAQFYAGLGATLSANPLRDASVMVAAVFMGCTSYVFIAKTNFSFLRATLSMGLWVVLAGCLLTFVLRSELLALAVASAGALLSVGFILYVTWRVFRSDELDDPVGDALSLLVQLRNLFMFLLRIFMSRR